MSGRRNNWGSNKNNNKYRSEHDDRTVRVGGASGGPSYRGGGGGRGNFKNRGGAIFKRGRGNFNRNVRNRLGDDDIDMDGSGDSRGGGGNTNRYSPYVRGNSRGRSSRGSSRGGRDNRPRLNNDQLQRMGLAAADQVYHSGGGRRELPDSDWYKITIPHGRKSEKEFLLTKLMEHINTTFVPFQFHYEQNSAVFHVNSKQAASEIQNTSKTISLPNGYKIIFVVRASEAPVTHLNPESLAKLKVCMSNRYDPSTKLLNLDELYHDDEMKKDGLHFALGKFNVMGEVLKIIKEHIPELAGLKLNGNRLYNLSGLKTLGDVAPQLVLLELGKNQLKTELELDTLRNLKLHSLVLDGNQLCDKFNDNATYISAIRKRFPKLMMLDGHNLPPPITFDIEAPTSLPKTLGSYFTNNEQTKELVCRFLTEYFKIYDSDDRQPLLNAYHENTIFSLSCSYNKLVVGNQPKFSDYLPESRNLLKIKENYKRQKMLKTGRLSVVAFLNQLPKTQHDTNSVVDIMPISNQLLSFTVSGVFKERASLVSHPTFRAFNRMFVAAPMGAGIVIVNEELFVTNATQKQLQNSFKTELIPVAVAAASPTPQIPGTSTSGTGEFEIQRNMIQQFAQVSQMNEEWSKRCLEQYAWDYDEAGKAFLKGKEQGSIPQEAFVKS